MNWQVQELDGTSVSDHDSKQEADYVANMHASDYQRPFKVVRTV